MFCFRLGTKLKKKIKKGSFFFAAASLTRAENPGGVDPDPTFKKKPGPIPAFKKNWIRIRPNFDLI